MTAAIDFYFDFVSPYSYLASTVLPRVVASHGAVIDYRPFTLIELMQKVGNRPTTIECQNKGVYVMADLERWAKRCQVAFAPNPAWPRIDFAELGRGALVALDEGRGADYVAAIFRAIWGEAADLSLRPKLMDVLAHAKLDGDRLFNAQRRRNTSRGLRKARPPQPNAVCSARRPCSSARRCSLVMIASIS